MISQPDIHAHPPAIFSFACGRSASIEDIARGCPVEEPVFSTSESAFRPTAMMFRNLAAMAVQEAMRRFRQWTAAAG